MIESLPDWNKKTQRPIIANPSSALNVSDTSMMSLWQMKKLGNNLDSPCPLFSRIVDIIFARFATRSDEGKTATNIGRIAAIYVAWNVCRVCRMVFKMVAVLLTLIVSTERWCCWRLLRSLLTCHFSWLFLGFHGFWLVLFVCHAN